MEQADRDRLDLFDKFNLFEVPLNIWFRMKEHAGRPIAAEGTYDEGVEAINVWATPKDKPEDYTHEVTSRINMWHAPRAFIASIRPEPSPLFTVLENGPGAAEIRHVMLYADFGASEPQTERRNGLFAKYASGIISTAEYEKSKTRSQVSDAECEWVRKKAVELREIASR